MGNVPRRGHGENMIRSGPSVLDHTTPHGVQGGAAATVRVPPSWCKRSWACKRDKGFDEPGVDLSSWDGDIRLRSVGGLDLQNIHRPNCALHGIAQYLKL